MSVSPSTKLLTRLLAILLVAGCMLALAAIGYVHYFLQLPAGSGPAGPKVSHEFFSKSWTTQKVFLVGLGDSVTAGFGARKGYSYFDRLVANPADEWPDMSGISLKTALPNLIASNLAISGSTSIEHIDRELPRLAIADSNTFGLVVITTGGNDLIHNYGRTPPRAGAMYGATWEQAQPWIKEFSDRLEKIITQIRTKFPGGCAIFLANIYDPTDDVGDIQRAGLPAWPDGLRLLKAYNEIIRQCADRHDDVYPVELHDNFLGHGIHCPQFWRKYYSSSDPHYWYNTNLEDPNERGYDVIRRLFLNAIANEACHKTHFFSPAADVVQH